MKIEIIGPGCKKCETTASRFRKVLDEMKVEAEFQHIQDMNELINRGIPLTPAVVIDGKTIAMGEVPSEEKIRRWLENYEKEGGV